MSDPARPAAGPPLVCPDCGKGRVTGTGVARCDSKGCEVDVHRFAPVVDAVPTGDAGRCARHPTKDGVAGCTRCGAFICDVCVTRTGEHVLCPACFDLLHGRGELATTKASRFRVDQLALVLLVLSLVPCCYGLPLPFALGFAIYGLRCRRSEPWLSKPMLMTTLVVASLFVAAGMVGAIVLMVGAAGNDG